MSWFSEIRYKISHKIVICHDKCGSCDRLVSDKMVLKERLKYLKNHGNTNFWISIFLKVEFFGTRFCENYAKSMENLMRFKTLLQNTHHWIIGTTIAKNLDYFITFTFSQ